MAKKADLKEELASLFQHEAILSLFQKVNKDDIGDKHEHIVRYVFDIIDNTDALKAQYLELCKDFPHIEASIARYVRAKLDTIVTGSVKIGLKERILDQNGLISSYTKLLIV